MTDSASVIHLAAADLATLDDWLAVGSESDTAAHVSATWARITCMQLGDLLRVIHYAREHGLTLRVPRVDGMSRANGTARADPPLVLELILLHSADRPGGPQPSLPPAPIAADTTARDGTSDGSEADGLAGQTTRDPPAPRDKIATLSRRYRTVRRTGVPARIVAGAVALAAVAALALALVLAASYWRRTPQITGDLVTERGYQLQIPVGWSARASDDGLVIELVQLRHDIARAVRLFSRPPKHPRIRVDLLPSTTFEDTSSQQALAMVSGYLTPPITAQPVLRIHDIHPAVIGRAPLVTGSVRGHHNVAEVIMVRHGAYMLVLHASAPTRMALWRARPAWRVVVESLRHAASAAATEPTAPGPE